MHNSKFNVRIIILLLLVFVFGLLTWLALGGSLASFENGVYSGLSRLISPALTSIMIFMTNIGSSVVIIAVAATLLMAPSTRKTFGVPVALNAILCAVLTDLLKTIIARGRPDILRLVAETGYSFPSGHASNSTALYVIISLIIFRKAQSNKVRIPALIVAAVLPVFIGISRIYLGVHAAGDVLAGWVLGATVALFVDTGFKRWQDQRPRA